MCTGFEMGMLALGTAATASQLAAPTPKIPSSMGAVPKSKVQQVSKQADKETANMVKSAKLRSGAATPPTLLTGSQGVGDENLNLGGSLLA